jgi:hypothetical protein
MSGIEPVTLSGPQLSLVQQLVSKARVCHTGRGGTATVAAINFIDLQGYNKNVVQALKTKGVLRPFRNGYRLMLDIIAPKLA